MRHFAHARRLTICTLWALTVICTRSVCGHLNVTGAFCNSCFVSSCGSELLTPHHDVYSGRPSGLTLWGAVRLHSVSVIFSKWWIGSFDSSQASEFLHSQWQMEFSTQHHVDRSARFVWNCVEFLFTKKWNSSFLRRKLIRNIYVKYINNNNNNTLSLVIWLLETASQLTLCCHGGRQLPVDTFDKHVQLIDLLNHLYGTFSKYLPTFLTWSKSVHLNILL